jgi:porphobilinogen synthase
VAPEHLVWPTFVVPGHDRLEPIASLPRVARRSVDLLLPELGGRSTLGVRSVMLFGVVGAEAKDALGSAAADPDGPVPSALRAARAAFGDDLVLMTDVCLCGYTDHGHCGVLAPPRRAPPRRASLDAPTLPRLAAMAVRHAEAGADVVAPSDMMDGRVGRDPVGPRRRGPRRRGDPLLRREVRLGVLRPVPRRRRLEPAGLRRRPPGPERPAQLPDGPAQRARGRHRGALDEAEGADLLMVKPALPYLDVVARVRALSDRAGRRLPGVGRVRDDRGRGRGRARSIARARCASRSRDPPRGRRPVLTYHALEAAAEGWLT